MAATREALTPPGNLLRIEDEQSPVRLGAEQGVIRVAGGRHRREVPAGFGLPSAAVAEDLSTEMVAVPACPGAPGSSELILEARVVQGGGRVLPVFSNVGKLVETLGQSQPWAVLPLERALAFAGAAGVEDVALDPVLSPGAWQWGPGDLAGLEQRRQAHG